MKNRNKPINVVCISYLANDDFMHQWGPLVFILEHIYNEMAIPRYETKQVKPGVYMNEVETRASIDTIQNAINLLMEAKKSGVFPELVDVTIKK